MKAVLEKIKSRRGLSIIVFLLMIAVVSAAVFIIAIPAYISHLKQVRLTFDMETVSTAHDVASVKYLQDGEPGIVTYYYDELSHRCLLRDEIGRIKPYGRSFASENSQAETGAAGVPNLGGSDGAQLIAVTIENNTVKMRWTGNKWSYNDYILMDDLEKSLLTDNDLHEMDTDSVSKAVSAAKEQYFDSYKKLIRKGENPGIAVYDYDILTDTVIEDETMSELEGAAKASSKTKNGNCSDIISYGLSDNADNTGAYIPDGQRRQEYIDVIPEMEAAGKADYQEDSAKIQGRSPKGCIVQVWIKAGNTNSSIQSAASTDNLQNEDEPGLISQALWQMTGGK